MCGISGISGKTWGMHQIKRMLEIQNHRGPDANDIYLSDDNITGLGHNRLSIIDLSETAKQPMSDPSGRYWMVFNGEVYNYLEIKKQLVAEFRFKTQSDSEVVLYAFIKWGVSCLDRFIGMFAIAIWDNEQKKLWIARDRLGVKPLNFAFDDKGNFFFASEIKALHAGGVPKVINDEAWASYLGYGRYDHEENTFWKGIYKLMPGHFLIFSDGELKITKWYDLPENTGYEYDNRPLETVIEEYFALLKENILLRFRSDVPVGINLSGGLDSSALLALVNKVKGDESDIKAFTFITGDPGYDELPWVNEMVSKTRHPLISCLLEAKDVPDLAVSVQYHQDEPFGGIPTLAYAKLFEIARQHGVIVLLDGQGMDEQWAGYDYYRNVNTSLSSPTIQGAKDSSVLPECIDQDYLELANQWIAPECYPDRLRNLQYRDAFCTKIPRALRFNDRISMRASTELREPFLDHRLFEIAFRQRPEYKIQNETGKLFMRKLLQNHLPGNIIEAPKRPLQTPQREWLRFELKSWVENCLEEAIKHNAFLKKDLVYTHWHNFLAGKSDNSFYVWQWISLAIMHINSI